MAFAKSAHAVARLLGIDIDDHPRLEEFEEPLRRVVPHTYREQEPTVSEYLRSLVPNRRGAIEYLQNLFPSAQWIPRYNWRWLLGDAIAGLTIGFVVVPQAMAYALLAELSPEYGLYTSFVGAATYWIFGTSKDIVIGTTAVGSLLVGSLITSVESQSPAGAYSRTEIAKAVSFIIGTILLVVGLLRLGWLIEFIPYVPISAFVTAASVTIISTQLSTALGISDIDTRQSPYHVLLRTLEGLPRMRLDAAIGISCIVMLFIVRDVCAKLEVKQPSRKRLWSTISSLRLTFAMLFYTLVSFLVNRTIKHDPKFRLVGKIDVGFRQAGPPRLDSHLVSLILPELPAMIIILVIEHIAIAKSFGRTFGYTVIPSQEILAQGAANFLGPFVGGYACTGSFGASAVLSKAGVRTPLAGLFSALILLLALYALTGVFYFIPKAALAGLIIHSVLNLLTPPSSLYRYWQLSPFELLIWIVGVTLAVFTDLETSIYCTIALSLALLLIRLARTRGRFLGRVRIGRVAIDVSVTTQDDKSIAASSGIDLPNRDAYLPQDRADASNPAIEVESSHPGVFIFRFTEGLNYVNQARQMGRLLRHVLENTRACCPDDGLRPSDRLWNDPGPTRSSIQADMEKPVLRAVVLDCSSVNNTDITSIQGLIDTRNFLDKHASPAIVEWHFAYVTNRWTRRALATAGFGFPVADKDHLIGNWAPVYTVSRSFAGATPENFREEAKNNISELEVDEERRCRQPVTKQEFEAQHQPIGEDQSSRGSSEIVERAVSQSSRTPSPHLVYGMDRPFFHIDLVEAVDAAVRDAKKADARSA